MTPFSLEATQTDSGHSPLGSKPFLDEDPGDAADGRLPGSPGSTQMHLFSFIGAEYHSPRNQWVRSEHGGFHLLFLSQSMLISPLFGGGSSP